jgi:3-phenylpropionate/trans-cinnamate dioxygenase ferredoxin component
VGLVEQAEEYVTVTVTVSDVPPGSLRCVEAAGTAVTLGNVDGVIYAVAAYCSHQRALLEEGDLDGTAVLCPWHAGSFDIVTGRVLSAPATEDIQTYPVRVAGEEIQVAVPAPESNEETER